MDDDPKNMHAIEVSDTDIMDDEEDMEKYLEVFSINKNGRNP